MTDYLKTCIKTLGEGLKFLADYFSFTPFYSEINTEKRKEDFNRGFQEDKVIENHLEKSILTCTNF